MDRRDKIALLKGIAKGEASITELQTRYVVATNDPVTGELIPYHFSGKVDPDREARSAALLKQSTTNPGIKVIRIVRE